MCAVSNSSVEEKEEKPKVQDIFLQLNSCTSESLGIRHHTHVILGFIFSVIVMTDCFIV